MRILLEHPSDDLGVTRLRSADSGLSVGTVTESGGTYIAQDSMGRLVRPAVWESFDAASQAIVAAFMSRHPVSAGGLR